MAMDDKHMDELFRQSLGTYKAEPSRGLWARIVLGLGSSTSGLWGTSGWKGSVYTAIILSVLGTSMYFILNNTTKNDLTNEDPITQTESPVDIESKADTIESSEPPVSEIKTNTKAYPPKSSIEATSNNNKIVQVEDQNTIVDNKVRVQATEILMKTNVVDYALVIPSNEDKDNRHHSDIIALRNNKEEFQPAITSSLEENQGFRPRIKMPKLNLGDIKIKKRDLQYQKYSKFSLFKNAFRAGQYTASLKYTPELVYIPGRKPDFNQGIDLDLGLLYQGLSIHTGIGITRSVELNEFTIRYITADSIGYYNHVLSYDYDPVEDSISFNTIEETLYDTVEHHSVQNQDRRYYFIRIPLMLGRDVWTYKRFNLRAKVGAMFQFKVMEDKSNYQLPEKSVAILEVKKNQMIPSRTNAYVLGALQMEYLLHHRISLSVEPTFRYYVKQPYEQFYKGGVPFSVGVRAGFIIYL